MVRSDRPTARAASAIWARLMRGGRPRRLAAGGGASAADPPGGTGALIVLTLGRSRPPRGGSPLTAGGGHATFLLTIRKSAEGRSTGVTGETYGAGWPGGGRDRRIRGDRRR